MKKHHTWICLILIVCLLFLSACGKMNVPASDAAQINDVLTATHDSTQATVSTDSESGQLQWKAATINTFAGIEASDSKKTYLYRLDYVTWLRAAALNKDKHSGCTQKGSCMYSTRLPCEAVDYFAQTQYTEDFFTANTLVVLGLPFDENNSAALKDVRYEDGKLTCFVELERPIRRVVRYNFRTVYVQIECVLPEDTEFELKVTAKQQTESELALQGKVSFKRLQGWDLWEKDEPQIAKVLDWETYQAFAAECAKHGVTCPTYSKEFFDDRSLVAVGLASGSGSTIFELYDLHYAQGVLTCFVDIPYTPGMLTTSDMASWLCFIEVDTILPADTEVILDSGGVEYDYDTYMQKYAQFQNLLIN